jgi:predicted ATPase
LSDLNSVPDQRTRRLYEDIQSGQLVEETTPLQWSAAPQPASQPRRLHNLPHRLSTFIGREKEIDLVLDILHSTRLLTITGPGGVGKTSLAVQAAVYLSAAIRTGAAFPDGIWLVELSTLDDPAMVAQACVQTLEVFVEAGQSATAALTQFLERKHLLLLLDNCEHLVDSCARLSDALLKSCPALSVLATSREPLRLPGEKIFALPPLPVPAPASSTSLDALSRIDSLRLFVERARLVSPTFTLRAENAAALALICRRLDGIPLALELAAARTRLLSVKEIAARLDDAFQVLAEGSRAALPRHQTLRVSMEWSFRLLSPDEQVFFANLAVFAGSWSLEAAEEVCSDLGSMRDPASLAEGSVRAAPASGGALGLLSRLVEKSLVNVMDGAAEVDGSVERRFTLLETIRQYAREQLFALEKPVRTGYSPVRDRHLAYFARLTARAADQWRGPEAAEWMDRLEKELANLYAALEWSLESADGRAIELGMQMVADLLEFWYHRTNSQDSLLWSDRLLAAEAGGRGGVPLTVENFPPNRLLQRARALRFLSHISWRGHYQQEDYLDHLFESETLLRALGSAARLELGITLWLRWSDLGRKADGLEQEFFEIFREEHARIPLADYHRSTAFRYLDQGEHALEIETLDHSLATYRKLGDWARIGDACIALARALLFQGEYQRARLLVQESITIARRLRTRSPEAWNWLILLEIARAEGSYSEGNSYAETALAISRYHNDTGRILLGLWMQGENLWSMGDLGRAKRCADETLEMCQENSFFREIGHYLLGRVALTAGRLADAEAHLGEAIQWMHGLTSQGQKANHLMGWVVLFARQEKFLLAARIAGAIDPLVQSWYKELSPFERSEYESALEIVRSSLPRGDFAAAWAEGKEMTLDQAQRLAG